MASRIRQTILLSFGLLLCAGGLVLYFGLYVTDFTFPVSRRVIPAVATSLLFWGLVTVLFHRRSFIVNLTISLVSFIVVAPFLAEVLLRTSIILGFDIIRNPQLYADPLKDDDYWKLRYKWNPDYIATGHDKRFVVDPLLGWTPPATPDNILGIVSDTAYIPDFSKPSLLFYGDSFVYGAMLVPVQQRIPQLLDEFLSYYSVYNYGVSAFGVDQIYLRFRETHSTFQKPLIFFGILTEDMDRSILNVHSAPKPRFTLKNGELDLLNTPIPSDSSMWYTQNPVAIDSYFLALVRRIYESLTGGVERQSEKKKINKKIIEAAVEEARKHDLTIVFVIFYGTRELEKESWREIFLKDLFAELDIPYIDTKIILIDEAKDKSMDVREFYLYKQNNDHPNGLGNCIIASAIAGYIADTISNEISHSHPADCFDRKW